MAGRHILVNVDLMFAPANSEKVVRFRSGSVRIIRARAQMDQLGADAACVWHVVNGGGYIGLEAAAALIKQGRCARVLEGKERAVGAH